MPVPKPDQKPAAPTSDAVEDPTALRPDGVTVGTAPSVADASELAALMKPADLGVVGGKPSLRIEAAPHGFYLRHYATNWEVEDEGLDAPTLLPELTRHLLRAGQLGVRTVNKGERPVDAYAAAVREYQAQGWVYLNPNEPLAAAHRPKGIPAGGYLRDVDCEDPVNGTPGKVFLDAWSVPVPTPRDEPQAFVFDRASYNRWRLWLVETKRIAPPSELVLTRMKARVETHLGRVQSRPNADAELKSQKVAAAKARLELVNKAITAAREAA